MRRRRSRPAIVLVVLSLPLGGCVPLIAPPVQVEAGVGARFGAKNDPSLSWPMFRASLRPLGLAEPARRRFDLGTGYLYHRYTSPAASPPSAKESSAHGVHGATIEGSYAVIGEPSKGPLSFRLSVGVGLRALFDPAGQVGRGGAVKVSGEWWTFGSVAGTSREGAFLTAGAMHGEGGFGFYAEVGSDQIGSLSGTTLAVGLSARLPALAGIGAGFPK